MGNSFGWQVVSKIKNTLNEYIFLELIFEADFKMVVGSDWSCRQESLEYERYNRMVQGYQCRFCEPKNQSGF